MTLPSGQEVVRHRPFASPDEDWPIIELEARNLLQSSPYLTLSRDSTANTKLDCQSNDITDSLVPYRYRTSSFSGSLVDGEFRFLLRFHIDIS